MSLCIGFGCGVILTPGRIACTEHTGLEPPPPPCPDGHGDLAFVIVSGVELGGLLHLMYACPSCDYMTVRDYPVTPDTSP